MLGVMAAAPSLKRAVVRDGQDGEQRAAIRRRERVLAVLRDVEVRAATRGVRGTEGGGERAYVAIDETTVILLHPPLPLVGVSIAMERERQQK